MPQVYRRGQSSRRNLMGRYGASSRKFILVIVVVALTAGGSYYGYQQFSRQTQTVIHNTPGKQLPQIIPNSQTMHFDQPLYGFDAPADWRLIKHDSSPYDLYSYRSSLVNADNRYLDIYVGKAPTGLAVNKAVAVRSQGTNLSHGIASDNCTTFTTGSPRTPGGAQPLAVVAKWDGVEFLCDYDNTQRNVIGTSAPGTVNQVILTSPTTGTHAFFFIYTDNNYNPDYSIFYRMLESFLVK